MTFGRTEMVGIVDLRSLGFYKIKQEVLQEHLGRHYHFQLADNVCDQYNRFVNLMRKEEESSEEKFPWLDDMDERKYIMDRELLDKYVNLDNSCLTNIEKKQVIDLLYQYKDQLCVFHAKMAAINYLAYVFQLLLLFIYNLYTVFIF